MYEFFFFFCFFSNRTQSIHTLFHCQQFSQINHGFKQKKKKEMISKFCFFGLQAMVIVFLLFLELAILDKIKFLH
jgi:fumarate reductase subunit D